MRWLLALPLIFATAAPLAAAETAWQEVSPGVRLRLIASDVRQPDGSTMVGLEIDMPANTKTYWRVPGETGLPAEFDTSGSEGVAAATPIWPYPTIEQARGYTDFVYYGPTVLPVKLQVASEAAELRLGVTLGICSDICVPAVADFELPLAFDKADPGHRLRLDQALAEAPLPWPVASDAVATILPDATGATIAVTLTDGAIDPASVLADAAGYVFGAPQKSRDGSVVTLPLLGGGDTRVLLGQPVRLTFLTPQGAYELTRTVGSASATASAW